MEYDVDIWFDSYGGACPQCSSTNTNWWTQEVEKSGSDEYAQYNNWMTCLNCGYLWVEDDIGEASNTYLLNHGWTQDRINDAVSRMKHKLKKLQNAEQDDDKQDDKPDE